MAAKRKPRTVPDPKLTRAEAEAIESALCFDLYELVNPSDRKVTKRARRKIEAALKEMK